MRGYVVLCYVCCYACWASQERINTAAVPTAPRIFFRPFSLCLAYPGFNEQCAQQDRVRQLASRIGSAVHPLSNLLSWKSQCAHHSKEAPLWHQASVLFWTLRLCHIRDAFSTCLSDTGFPGFELLLSNSFHHRPSLSRPSVFILCIFSSPLSSALKLCIQILLPGHSLWQESFICWSHWTLQTLVSSVFFLCYPLSIFIFQAI